MGTEEMRRSLGPTNSGESGDIGETGEDRSSGSLEADFCGVDRNRLDFEEDGRATLGNPEYEACCPPCRFLFTMTVPVEFDEEREESDSFVATG